MSQKRIQPGEKVGPKLTEAERAKTIAKQAVKLAEWAAQALVTAKLLRIEHKPVGRFPLNEGEREFLATLSPVTPNLKKKLAKQDSEFTVAEVASLTMAVAESLLDAEPKQQVALLMVAKSLMDCLQERIAGADEPARPKTKPTK
jgi:hypothetical protein